MKTTVYAALCVLLLLFACNDAAVLESRDNGDLRVTDGRLVFANEKVFIDQLERLGKANGAGIQEWQSKYKIHSLKTALENADDESNLWSDYGDYPRIHQLILNSDGIVQVGEYVIRYSNGNKYYLTVEKFEKISKLEDFATQADKKGLFTITTLGKNTAADARYFDAPFYGNDGAVGAGGDQHEFAPTAGDSFTSRKYITEFASVRETLAGFSGPCEYYDTYVTLYLRIKLEWRSKKNGWREAGDPREISYNVSLNGQLRFYAPCQTLPSSFPFSKSVNSVSATYPTGVFPYTGYSWDVPIISVRQLMNVDYSDYAGLWYGTVTGTTYQRETNASNWVPWTVTF